MLRILLCVTFLGVVTAIIPDLARWSTPEEDYVVPRNITPLCLSHATHWMSKLRQGELWALKMLDSWTKLPSGVLIRSRNHMGNFDQCLQTSVEDNFGAFSGHYCRAWLNINIPGQVISTPIINYGFCVPSTCAPEEIPTLLKNVIAPALGIKIELWRLIYPDCHIKELLQPLPTGALIFVILTCILGTIVVLSALAEWRLKEKTSAFVRACSLTNTCRSLFNIRKRPSDISCLHGLRVGSMLWVLIGHRYQLDRSMPHSNPAIYDTYFANPLAMTIGNALPSVDTFFLLSGLLMCTSFLHEVKTRASFDVIKFYIYRYLRIVIPMGGVILINITISPILGDGPLWNNFFPNESLRCKYNWWTNLVFVNNYIYVSNVGACVSQTWYTAVDMQLAWLSPLVLLPLYHSPRAGLQLMTLLILISCFIPFTLTYIYHFPMNLLQVALEIPMEGVPEGGSFAAMVYVATQSRATPYLCGILFGYYLFSNRNKTIRVSKILMYLGWFCSTVVAIVVIYSLSIPHQPDYVYNLLGSAFYAGFHRLAWSAVLTWIIFACVNGFGGVINKILSSHLLLPLSRLTYSVFLVHILILSYDTATTRVPVHVSHFDSVHDFFGDIAPVYFLSFILYILVEGPTVSLLRVAFTKGRQTKRSKK